MTRWIAVVAAAALAAPLFGQGLQPVEQGARALGMAGAVTAQVDDPTAIWYNPGALGILTKKKGVAAGLVTTKERQSLFQGLPPGIGAGTTGEEETRTRKLPYAFATLPFGARFVTGVGIYSPYRIESDWSDPASYAGRFLAFQSKIETTDITPVAAMRIAPGIGVGAGLVYRTSQLSASRRLPSAGTEIGSIAMKTDSVRARGWTAGLSVRPGDALSFGAAYRSAIAAGYGGGAALTQIPTGNAQLDQLVAATFPFGKEVALSSRLEFPSQTSAGIALGKAPFLVELDAVRTDWTGVPAIAFAFPNDPVLSTTYALNLKSSTSYRAGVRWQFPTGPQLRFGWATAKSPQPDETVGAFLADAGRNTLTAGFGLDWLDVAFGYVNYQKREITTNTSGLNGVYRRNGWTFTLSVTK